MRYQGTHGLKFLLYLTVGAGTSCKNRISKVTKMRRKYDGRIKNRRPEISDACSTSITEPTLNSGPYCRITNSPVRTSLRSPTRAVTRKR